MGQEILIRVSINSNDRMAAAAVGSENRLSFLYGLSERTGRVLILDYDGTVAPFSSDRSNARPYDAIPLLLKDIMQTCSTRLIVISGRSAREIPRLLATYPMPEIWGSHGVERLYPDGRYVELNVSDEALRALAEAECRLDEASLARHTEVKLAAVAVHWRGLEPADVLKIRVRAYRVLEPIASQSDLMLAEFAEGVELRLRSANKGEAVRNLVRELGSEVPVAYLGDDIDDEGAFRVLNGRGLTVLISAKMRFTAAQVVLKPPHEVVGFLRDWIRACQGQELGGRKSTD
jgi:trehalose 6-phosphate phosphatase